MGNEVSGEQIHEDLEDHVKIKIMSKINLLFHFCKTVTIMYPDNEVKKCETHFHLHPKLAKFYPFYLQQVFKIFLNVHC